MESISVDYSSTAFDSFKNCNFDAVLEIQDKIKDSIDKTDGDEENEGFLRQKKLVETLVEYYKDNAKDPKKAYKALSEIDNEDKQEPFWETNFLLEYNAGVFAYLSQMYGKALEHFCKILEIWEEAEFFLVIKSAFIWIQILIDCFYLDPAKVLIMKLEELLPLIKKVMVIKQGYKTSQDSERNAIDFVNTQISDLYYKFEYFSVSTGSYLSQGAKAPKNPWILEYEFFLTYFKTRIALVDWEDEKSREKWLKELSDKYSLLEKRKEEKMPNVDEIMLDQAHSFLPYLNSYAAMQDIIVRTKKTTSTETTQLDGIRLMSFNDRDHSKNGPNAHASWFKTLKESDKRKEQIIQNWNQKHPIHFFNNLGVLHLNLKKYGMAAFFLSKALKYLSLDGKQNPNDLKSPLKFVSNHTSQK